MVLNGFPCAFTNPRHRSVFSHLVGRNRVCVPDPRSNEVARAVFGPSYLSSDASRSGVDATASYPKSQFSLLIDCMVAYITGLVCHTVVTNITSGDLVGF